MRRSRSDLDDNLDDKPNMFVYSRFSTLCFGPFLRDQDSDLDDDLEADLDDDLEADLDLDLECLSFFLCDLLFFVL